MATNSLVLGDDKVIETMDNSIVAGDGGNFRSILNTLFLGPMGTLNDYDLLMNVSNSSIIGDNRGFKAPIKDVSNSYVTVNNNLVDIPVDMQDAGFEFGWVSNSLVIANVSAPYFIKNCVSLGNKVLFNYNNTNSFVLSDGNASALVKDDGQPTSAAVSVQVSTSVLQDGIAAYLVGCFSTVYNSEPSQGAVTEFVPWSMQLNFSTILNKDSYVVNGNYSFLATTNIKLDTFSSVFGSMVNTVKLTGDPVDTTYPLENDNITRAFLATEDSKITLSTNVLLIGSGSPVASATNGISIGDGNALDTNNDFVQIGDANTVTTTSKKFIQIGNGNSLDGEAIFQLGTGLISSGNSFALGKYNDNTNAPVIAIGNGVDAANRSNFLAVYADGDMVIDNKHVVKEEGGASTARPASPRDFQFFFDTTLNKPIWFNGTDWCDATGTVV